MVALIRLSSSSNSPPITRTRTEGQFFYSVPFLFYCIICCRIFAWQMYKQLYSYLLYVFVQFSSGAWECLFLQGCFEKIWSLCLLKIVFVPSSSLSVKAMGSWQQKDLTTYCHGYIPTWQFKLCIYGRSCYIAKYENYSV